LRPEALGLGIDLGTSGIRLAVVNAAGQLQVEISAEYPAAFEDPQGWCDGLRTLCAELPAHLRAAVAAVAIDGTSGTLLLCRPDGGLGQGALARALPYHLACPEWAEAVAELVGAGGAQTPAGSASGSLARALRLLEQARQCSEAGPWWLRHQADWLMGWLLGDWRWGEEANNLRLGWNQFNRAWMDRLAEQSWSGALPQICRSGEALGPLAPGAAAALDLQPGDGVAVLGTTLVLKQFSDQPLQGPGISCQRVAGRWLVGGASNAGAGVLRRFFTDAQLMELSRQIDPRRCSGLQLRPLPRPGERFPVDDPGLEPVLEPRPVSDALYLQALLEGLAEIEQAGWRRLQQLGAPPVQRVISLGGGARNPQWRAIRQRVLERPVLNRPQCSAALGMARLAISAVVAR
jgi:sugar (pentulose or hexulose) kinase